MTNRTSHRAATLLRLKTTSVLALALLTSASALATTACTSRPPHSDTELAAAVDGLPGVEGSYTWKTDSFPFANAFEANVTVSESITESQLVDVFEALWQVPGFENYAIHTTADEAGWYEYNGPVPNATEAEDIAQVWLEASELTQPHELEISPRYADDVRDGLTVSLELNDHANPTTHLDWVESSLGESTSFIRGLEGLQNACDLDVSFYPLDFDAAPLEPGLLDVYDAVKAVGPVTAMSLTIDGTQRRVTITVDASVDLDAAQAAASRASEALDLETTVLQAEQG